MNPIIINVILFQTGWFACVLSGAASVPWLGVLIALSLMTFHVWRAPLPISELYLLVIAMSLGAVWDSCLVMLSYITYTSGTVVNQTAPLWIVLLWGLFASTLNVSMRWLKRRYVIAGLLGAVAGPLAYYGGSKLGALTFINPELALMYLAAGWAVMTPILVKLGEHFDGFPTLGGDSK